MLALHVGMRIRLLDALDEKKTLVKDTEGEIVRIEPHPEDQAMNSREEDSFARKATPSCLRALQVPEPLLASNLEQNSTKTRLQLNSQNLGSLARPNSPSRAG